MDEDGFFEGELNGRVGLIPSNMVELISDQEELDKIQDLLQAQKEKAGTYILQNHVCQSPVNHSPQYPLPLMARLLHSWTMLYGA